MEPESTSGLTNENLWTLGDRLLTRFQKFGDLDDLQQAISVLEALVLSTSIRDGRYIAALANLGVVLSYRFRRTGELGDLEQAISRSKDAVDLTPDGHPQKPSYLSSLGNSFLARFERIGELHDLEEAISRHRDAVGLAPDGHPRKPGYLNNLGSSFFARFGRIGELHDLEEAILGHRDAVGLTPDGHPQKSGYLNNLGNSFVARFKRIGELHDLEEAISRHRDAVGLTPDGHPQKPSYLSSLGDSFVARFERIGELHDLEEAISRHRDAVGLTPDGHPQKPGYLSSLGLSFVARFERVGELHDLEEAVSIFKDANDLTPDSHPSKPSRLGSLGKAFITRFERFGEPHDLEQAISRHREAAELTPDGHPDRPARLSNLGRAFTTRFQRFGEPSDLKEAVSRHWAAVDLIADGHPNKPRCLDNLGNSFLTCFECLGQLSDLEQAISRHRAAVDLTSDAHPDKPGYLSNLGTSLVARLKCLGDLSDLEEAVSRHRDAIELTPNGHPDKPVRLNNLGTAFFTRFEYLSQLDDLEQAVSRYKHAVGLTPDDHPWKPSFLNNLGSSFIARFGQIGDLHDLEEAISRLRDAVDLTPDDYPNKPVQLNNLGNSFIDRFKRIGELHDLEEAISKHRDAVDLTPDGHLGKPLYLKNLGNSLLIRFERLGELGEIEQAIARHSNAVDLTPDGHPSKPSYLICLGDAYKLRARSNHPGRLSDLERAVSLYSHAACASTGPTIPRLNASRMWISCASVLGHPSLLRAFSVSIGLLPQLAWSGFPLPHRYRELVRGVDVVQKAVAAALNLGLPETAVEWLEQGRSIVWDELFQLRSSYDGLSAIHPDLAHRLRALSVALEHAATTHEKSLSSLSEMAKDAEHRRIESLEQQAEKHRKLAIQRDKLVQEIRGLPGFEQFLLHKEFPRIRASAHSGPVVILNAATDRCDALIVRADVEHAIHVPLSSFTLGRCVGLREALKVLLGHARAIPCDEREGKPDQRRGVNWESVLSVLWTGVVKPILDVLNFSVPGKLSRIFWCPTGPFTFLPIHAAGLYGTQFSGPGHKVSDFVISSYIPTLSILPSSPEPDATPSGDFHFLTVRKPSSDGQSPLPGVDTELKYIRGAIQNSPSAQVTLLEPSTGTVEEVLALMKQSEWVHFACHGIQDATNPTDSGLCLANQRRLKLSDIIGLSRPYGGLAFLSACQTAMGDEDLSDEAIHIAAGMLFAGYGGVVGTMWSISDRLAPRVAKDVYEQLFRDGTKPDYRDAARALHDAVGRLQDNHASFDEWLPFIHVGL